MFHCPGRWVLHGTDAHKASRSEVSIEASVHLHVEPYIPTRSGVWVWQPDGGFHKSVSAQPAMSEMG